MDVTNTSGANGWFRVVTKKCGVSRWLSEIPYCLSMLIVFPRKKSGCHGLYGVFHLSISAVAVAFCGGLNRRIRSRRGVAGLMTRFLFWDLQMVIPACCR